MNSLGSGFFPRNFIQDPSPAIAVMVALLQPKQRTSQAYQTLTYRTVILETSVGHLDKSTSIKY